jgi:hypothetical protein
VPRLRGAPRPARARGAGGFPGAGMQTFLVSATNKQLYTHVTAKHDKISKEPEKCFPCLKGFDPNAPAPAAAAPAPAKKKVAKKKEDDLSSLLSEGLTVSKKKK